MKALPLVPVMAASPTATRKFLTSLILLFVLARADVSHGLLLNDRAVISEFGTPKHELVLILLYDQHAQLEAGLIPRPFGFSSIPHVRSRAHAKIDILTLSDRLIELYLQSERCYARYMI
jgi:hypothetical protein